MNRSIAAVLGFTMLAGGTFATKGDVVKPQPNIVDDLMACRPIHDVAARVACYDDRVDKIAAARDSDNLVVLDRQQVHEARRSLFGFTLPKLPFLQEKKDTANRKVEETESVLDSTIRSARPIGLHEWRIVLEDGAAWETSEAPDIDPASGDPIHIRRAALGSYLANIHGQRAVRIRRVG